jgi:hypothetical protein
MVNEWNKTALVAEFETMLQRRLRSGAAPVAACAGFDLDAASAYLEGALGESHRAGYESHLAGCATCRRHLIELARLAQTTPLVEAQPATAPGRISAWDRWKEAVAVWFDLSSWNFKWRIAGATGAAFAILIAAFGAQFWRQASKKPYSVAPLAVTEVAPQESNLQSPTTEPLLKDVAISPDADTPIAQNLIASNSSEGQSRVPAPAPLVGPQGNVLNVPVETANRAFALNADQPGEAPVAPKPMPTLTPYVAETGQSPSPRLGGFVANEGARSVLMDSGRDLKEEEIVQGTRISPPSELNPMNPEPPSKVLNRRGLALLSEGRPAPKGDTRPRQQTDISLSRLREILSGVVRRGKSAFNEESPDDESTTPMIWPFRGKIFISEKGVLIDQEYKPEMQEWRCWTLTRGDEEYKRALADEPQLKDFFDHAPILIVWKNRIYKVLK